MPSGSVGAVIWKAPFASVGCEAVTSEPELLNRYCTIRPDTLPKKLAGATCPMRVGVFEYVLLSAGIPVSDDDVSFNVVMIGAPGVGRVRFWTYGCARWLPATSVTLVLTVSW